MQVRSSEIFIYYQQPPIQPDPNLIALSPLLIFTCKKLLKGSNLPYGPVRQFWNWVNVHEVSREYIIISWKSLKNWNMSAIFAKLKMVLNFWIGFFFLRKALEQCFLGSTGYIQFLALTSTSSVIFTACVNKFVSCSFFFKFWSGWIMVLTRSCQEELSG